jgi:hypothetical protein
MEKQQTAARTDGRVSVNASGPTLLNIRDDAAPKQARPCGGKPDYYSDYSK